MISSNMYSQVTFQIIRFMASYFNGWKLLDAQFKFKKDLEGNYSVTNP
ncbi:hypothetical protein [Epilithonimonas hominis]|nr:hypothetical protein [Epilithonimonas hominis]